MVHKSKKKLLDGTKRIKSIDLAEYIIKNSSWKKCGEISQNLFNIVDHYKQKNNFDFLVENNELKYFLKGTILPCGNISGQRINYLPCGKKLARGGFSLFAKNLKFNLDNSTNWSVMYENASGLKTYLYDEDNVHLEQEKKAKLVDKFIILCPKLLKKLKQDLKEKKQIRHLALFTLLKTFMRIGNLEYYLKHSHMGLTTLQKRNIYVSKNIVTFNFVGKDGVPQHIVTKFPPYYIELLTSHLNNLYADDFVFADTKGIPIHSSTLSKLMFEYTNEHFYPHIIRSYYADSSCLNFINSHKSATKQEVKETFLEIAKNLGHKHFNKKTNTWEIDYSVTLTNYIRPKYSEKLLELIKE